MPSYMIVSYLSRWKVLPLAIPSFFWQKGALNLMFGKAPCSFKLRRKPFPCGVEFHLSRWGIPNLLIYPYNKQGQAIGYGRITQVCPLPFWGHYFHMVTQANSMDRISSTRYQMKDMNMIFQLIPQNPILVEWFSHSGWSKLGGF